MGLPKFNLSKYPLKSGQPANDPFNLLFFQVIEPIYFRSYYPFDPYIIFTFHNKIKHASKFLEVFKSQQTSNKQNSTTKYHN